MSKADALRAMREKRYSANKPVSDRTTASTRKQSDVAPVDPKAPAPKKAATGVEAPTPDPNAPVPSEELCGHRSMNGRTCTRPSGHSEKNHRYS